MPLAFTQENFLVVSKFCSGKTFVMFLYFSAYCEGTLNIKIQGQLPFMEKGTGENDPSGSHDNRQKAPGRSVYMYKTTSIPILISASRTSSKRLQKHLEVSVIY